MKCAYRDNFKIKKLKSFFILKFYHSNSRRTLRRYIFFSTCGV